MIRPGHGGKQIAAQSLPDLEVVLDKNVHGKRRPLDFVKDRAPRCCAQVNDMYPPMVTQGRVLINCYPAASRESSDPEDSTLIYPGPASTPAARKGSKFGGSCREFRIIPSSTCISLKREAELGNVELLKQDSGRTTTGGLRQSLAELRSGLPSLLFDCSWLAGDFNKQIQEITRTITQFKQHYPIPLLAIMPVHSPEFFCFAGDYEGF
ncbi:hypothetical protein C8R44DRAFT_733299 [Mycena epipterygia]|nr:hypothetical protein C8R44DRAFT_733299 [Mycena epipterygia]